jgi:hypothetical protein
MPLPRAIDIDGRRYLWRDLIALRQAQAQLHAPALIKPACERAWLTHRSEVDLS